MEQAPAGARARRLLMGQAEVRGWFDENGKPFELVDHPSRKRLAAEKRTAAMEDSPRARV